MPYVISFVVALALLIVASRLVHFQVITALHGATRSERLATLLFALLFLPGTTVHELSHWVAARGLGVSTGQISLLPKPKGKDGLVLGFVTVGNTDPVRASLIGVAPLIGGSLIVLWLVQHVLGMSGPETLFYDENGLVRLWEQIVRLFGTQDVWLYLYLLFTISNNMLPSPSDRHAWPTLLVYTSIVAGVAYWFGGTPHIPGNLLNNLALTADYLTFAFLITVLLDLAVLIVLVPLGFIVTRGLR